MCSMFNVVLYNLKRISFTKSYVPTHKFLDAHTTVGAQACVISRIVAWLLVFRCPNIGTNAFLG